MTEITRSPLFAQIATLAGKIDQPSLARFFDRPLIILSAPRSGSTLLFETLVQCGALWSIGEESHVVFSAFPELHPARRGFASGRLTERDATPEICHRMRAAFRLLLRDRDGMSHELFPLGHRPDRVRLLEKTPRNALNVRFLRRVFPDAKFVFLFRDPRETIASIAEAWRVGLETGRFVTFPDLPGWERRHWCLLLPPGWRALNGKSLIEIAAFQWAAANRILLDDLGALSREKWIPISFDELVSEPARAVCRILDFAGIQADARLDAAIAQPLPPSSTTVSESSPGKWMHVKDEIESCAPVYADIAKRLARLTAS